ncbi:4-alpha-glucanotransferase [soil metagenome]
MTPDAAAWGVQLRYRQSGGREQVASPSTIDSLLGAMRAEAEQPPASRLVTTCVGSALALPGAAEVTTEEGHEIALHGDTLPADLPQGYHRVTWRDGAPPSLLVVSPGRCHPPAALRTWGWAVQLYALRSRASWGLGDLADLGRLMRWARTVGAGMTMINPLHAVNPGTPQQPSPYFPSSRCWRNPLYIRIEDVAGAKSAGLALDEIAAVGRALNDGARIDRDEVLRLKTAALELLWRRGEGAPEAFETFLVEHARGLEGFATFAALIEHHGREPASWPRELRHPGSPAVARFRTDNAERVRFHSWLQWLLDRQLARATAEGPLIQDLAIGVDPAGADAWLWQDVFAAGVRVGAPPDAFNSLGQDWGALAFDPWALRAAEYEPFIQTVRSALAPGGGLRIDHVMGLWRLFWIPAQAGPAEGAYVRYRAAELLDILALESERAGAYVIGEDLGTVEQGVRKELAARDMLSYRLLWFERGAPATYPSKALAAITNHDLPTIAGLWSGRDLATQRDLGLQPDEGAHAALRRRVAKLAGVDEAAGVRDVIDALARVLASAPSALLAATLEDALAVTERPNHPGSTTGWPNWCLPLPLALEDLERDEGVRSMAETLSRAPG